MILLGIYLSSCMKTTNESVIASLNVVQDSEQKFLRLYIYNNTSRKIYINNISGIAIFQWFEIYNEKGEIITDKFIDKEFLYHKEKPRMYKSGNNSILLDYNDLYRPPFTENKELIKKAVDIEYKELLKNKNPRLIFDRDIELLKNRLFMKYSRSIFIEPKSYYYDSITINTLFQWNEDIRIVFHYKVEKNFTGYINFDYGKDSLRINSKTLDRIDDYVLFDKEFTSDTILISNGAHWRRDTEKPGWFGTLWRDTVSIGLPEDYIIL